MFRHTAVIARCGALFALAMVAGSVFVRALLPFPRIPQVRAKLEAFRKTRSCEVAFFGSSKTHTGVIPKRFDRLLRERGFSVRSFNFGVDGMGFPESGFLCEQALRQRPRKLRWVFIESGGVRTRIPPAQRGTRRSVYWHDVRRTLTIGRTILGRNENAREESASALLGEHLGLFLKYASNAGEGAELLREALQGAPSPDSSERLIDEERGYFALGGRPSPGDAARIVADLGRFAERARPESDVVEQRLLNEFALRVQRAGATVIFVVPPNPKRTPPIFTDRARPASPAVFAFDDPERYPELYQPENRSDWAHLNDQGARLFTAALAARFAEFLAGG